MTILDIKKHWMYKMYLDYIKNTGGNPTTKNFDEDWEPIGLIVRTGMVEAGLITEKDGKITINPIH